MNENIKRRHGRQRNCENIAVLCEMRQSGGERCDFVESRQDVTRIFRALCDDSRGKKQEQRRIKTGVSSHPGVGEGGVEKDHLGERRLHLI